MQKGVTFHLCPDCEKSFTSDKLVATPRGLAFPNHLAFGYSVGTLCQGSVTLLHQEKTA